VANHDLLLTFDFPPLGGGISRWMEEIARGYPAGSLIVSTSTLAGHEEIDASLANVVDRITISSHRLRTVQGLVPWSNRVARLARDLEARFAWCGNIRPAAYPALWAKRRTGLPYGLIVHGGDLLRLRQKIVASRLKSATYRTLFSSASVVVANSNWTASLCLEVMSEMGVSESKVPVTVIPLGTTPERFRPNERAVAKLQAKFDLPKGKWLVTVARLVPHKGIDTAIRVLSSLVTEFPDLRYAVVGFGPYEQPLRALADSLGVASRVHFLEGIASDDVPAVFAMADVYLGLSRQEGLDVEGFGISLLEASSSSVPVVAGASGGIPDAVDDGVTGILVSPEDVAAATAAVRRLLVDSDVATAMGAAGRRRVIESFNWGRVVDDLRQLSAEYGRK
jgi:phosphatidylinositol alpha-1,6-mannosyltransferase